MLVMPACSIIPASNASIDGNVLQSLGAPQGGDDDLLLDFDAQREVDHHLSASQLDASYLGSESRQAGTDLIAPARQGSEPVAAFRVGHGGTLGARHGIGRLHRRAWHERTRRVPDDTGDRRGTLRQRGGRARSDRCSEKNHCQDGDT